MILDLIVAVVAGFAAGGIAYLMNRVTGGRLPRWLVPVTAGAAMLGYTIWSEYAWADRIQVTLPESVTIVSANQSAALWRPWSYVFPVTNRMIAIDGGSVTPAGPAAPGQVLANVYLMARSLDTIGLAVLFDCEGQRRADLIDGADVTPEGVLEGGEWRSLAADDPMLVAACGGG
jgi:hypothetical protein